MLRVITISSEGERRNADRLAALIRSAWPGIEASQSAQVTVAAGLKLVRESDLLVTFDLDEPRTLAPRRRRDGSPFRGGSAQAGVIVIECKALDRSRLEPLGNDLIPIYGNQKSRHSVLSQLKDQIDGLARLRAAYDQPFFIHGLAWMLGVTQAELHETAPDLSPSILGSDISWLDMLAAAAWEHACIAEPLDDVGRVGVRFATERLTRERRASARDLAKLDRFTTEVVAREVADDVAAQAGAKQVRLIGGPGSGKSTTLALVAKRLVERDSSRILLLTYNAVLRSELQHLIRTIFAPAAPEPNVRVMLLHDFLGALFAQLGGVVPRKESGAVDFAALPEAIEAWIRERGPSALEGDAKVLREVESEAFDFDYVFVDEAQDWQPAYRDLLRVLFRPRAIVLADGRDQFAQSQTRCDWTSGLAKDVHFVRQLNRSLRMSANVAAFVTAFARAMGYHDWTLQTHPDLVGGRVVLASDSLGPGLFARVLEIGKDAHVSPGDCLIAVPPSLVETDHRGKHARIATLLESAGIGVWDGTDPELRRTAREPGGLPIVPYDSLRGLEGWATFLLELDERDRQRLKYPNLAPGETVNEDDVARRSLLLALTRAAHVLVVTVKDAGSRTSGWLEEAAREVGPDIVERWT